MALLKKIKASSLMETLVATVLIVIIFMVSSMVLNNIIARNVRQNTERVEERMNRLEYEYRHRAFQLPYLEDFESWEISVFNRSEKNGPEVVVEAMNTGTKKLLVKSMIREY